MPTSAAAPQAQSVPSQAVGAAVQGTQITGKERHVDESGKPVLPWAFIDCDSDDLVVLIAHMLNKLMEHNDQVVLTSSSLTRFHSRAPPAISVIDYLRRIVKYTNLERLPLLSLLAYIDITCTSLPTFTLSSLTVHRFLIAGVTAGSKALCDVFCTNAHYAKVGGIKVNELNALERELVKVTDWNLCVHAELLQQYYTSLIRSHGGYVQSPQPSVSPFTSFPLPDPEEGLFEDLEIELMKDAEGWESGTAKGLVTNRLNGVPALAESPENDEMDGKHQSRLIRPEVAGEMDVDGDDEKPRNDSATLVTATRAGGSGMSTSTVRIQQQRPSTKEMVDSSSPMSSDTATSSQIDTSSGSKKGMEGLIESHISSHQQSPGNPSLYPSSSSSDLISTSSSRTTSIHSSPRTYRTSGGPTLSTSLKSTQTGGNLGSSGSIRTGSGAGRQLSKSAVPFPMTMTSSPASPRIDKTSAGAEDMVGVVVVVPPGDSRGLTGGASESDGQGQGIQEQISSPAHRKISIVHAQAMAELSERERDHLPREAGMETDEITGRQHAREREWEHEHEWKRERGRRASSPAISTQTNMREGRKYVNSELQVAPDSSSRSTAVLSGLQQLAESPLPQQQQHQHYQPATVSQPQRFKRFVGNLFRSKSVSSAIGRDSALVVPADQEHFQAGSAPLSTVQSNPLVSNRTASPRRPRSMIPSGSSSVYDTAMKTRRDRTPSTASLSISPRDMSSSTHSSTQHPGSVTPRIRTRCERSTSPVTRPLHDVTMDLEMEPESSFSGSRSRFSHSPKRSRISGDVPVQPSSISSESGSVTSQSSVSGKTERLVATKTNQNGGNASAIDWKCRSASSAGFDGVVDGLGVG